jgi:hypothetical protein
VISSNEVNLGEDGFTVEAGGEILNMWNYVLVGYDDTIKTSTLRFGNHVKWRSPRTAGRSNNSLDEHNYVEIRL